MKFNWGHGIALFFSFFVAITIFQVIKSKDYDHALVKEDYYVDDIELDELLEKRSNANKLSGLAIQQLDDKAIFRFIIPHNKPISGLILFSSPVNEKQDRVFPIQLNGDTMEVDIKDLRSGRWNIHMEWSDGEKGYVYEERVVLS